MKTPIDVSGALSARIVLPDFEQVIYSSQFLMHFNSQTGHTVRMGKSSGIHIAE